MFTALTNDHLKFRDICFYFTFINLPPSPMAEYFLMQVLSSSSSIVRPISDIFDNIGCTLSDVMLCYPVAR